MSPSQYSITEWYYPTIYWDSNRSNNDYFGYYFFDWRGVYRFPDVMTTHQTIQLHDYGPEPAVIDIEAVTEQNNNYRLALWTGKHLQVTLMTLQPGEEIGLERHPNTDQFLRIEDGEGIVKMGDRQDNLTIEHKVEEDDAILIPAGTWHNLMNTGRSPLKLYSIYAPPQHPFGTVHATPAAAQAAEE